MKPAHVLWIFGLVLLAAFVWYGWNPPSVSGLHGTYRNWMATETTPHTPKSLRQIPADVPFRIVLGQGSGRHGFNVLDVSEGGKCTFYSQTGSSPRAWDVYEYMTDVDTVLSIKRYVATLDLPSRPHMTSSKIHDGGQWSATVWIDGRHMTFWFSNSFPWWYIVALSGRLKVCLPPPGAAPTRTIDGRNAFYEELKRIGVDGSSGMVP